MSTTTETEWPDPEAVAKAHDISRALVYKLIQKDKLRYRLKLGIAPRYLIDPASISEYLASRQRPKK